MTIHAIHHVQLAFPSERGADVHRFYSDLLGLHELPSRRAGTLQFAAGAQRIELVPAASWRPQALPVHLAFEVSDLPSLRQRLLAEGLPLVESQALPGYLRFYAKDPAGNPLEFLQPDPEWQA